MIPTNESDDSLGIRQPSSKSDLRYVLDFDPKGHQRQGHGYIRDDINPRLILAELSR
jgi:hypothetical protein